MLNIYCLAFILLVELLLIPLFTHEDYLSMTFLGSGMFFILSVAYSICFDTFGRDISIETIFVIQCTLFFIAAGEWMGKTIVIRKFIAKSSCMTQARAAIPKAVLTSKTLTWLLFFVFLGCGILSFYSLYSFSVKMGNYDVYATVAYTRAFLTSEEKMYRNPISYFQYLLMGIAYVYLFYYFYNRILCGKKESILLLPPLGYFFFLLTTTSRINMIEMGLVALGLALLMLRKKGSKALNAGKIAKVGITFAVSLFVIMYAYGYFVRNRDLPFAYFFNAYFTAGLYGLDEYIRFPWEDDYFAQRSFHEIYVYIEKITGENFNFGRRFLPFFRFRNGGSNVYTGIMPLILDFGMVGMLLIYMGISVVYSWMGKKIRRATNIQQHVLCSIFYAFFFYIAVFIGIDPRLGLILSVPFLFRIFAAAFGNWLYLKFAKESDSAEHVTE